MHLHRGIEVSKGEHELSYIQIKSSLDLSSCPLVSVADFYTEDSRSVYKRCPPRREGELHHNDTDNKGDTRG